MRIYREDDYCAMSRRGADILAAQLLLRPDSVLGLATGVTPMGMYRELVEKNHRGELDFSRVRTVNLDEYVGLAPDHEQSYRYFMQRNLFDHVNINPDATHVPDGRARCMAAECRRYDQLIEDLGGIDLQVLGIGRNGHIGFNEPGDEFPLGTHVAELADSTIDANARFFASRDQVPRKALSMGIRSIFQARRILLMVSGREKADIVAAALKGPVTPRVTASVLQLHPDVILVGDREALSGL